MKHQNKTPTWVFLFIMGILILAFGVAITVTQHRDEHLVLGLLFSCIGVIILCISFILVSGKIPFAIYKFRLHVYRRAMPLHNHVDFVLTTPDDIKTQLKKKYGRNPFKKSNIIIEDIVVFENNTSMVHSGKITGFIKDRGSSNARLTLSNISFDEEIKNIINQKMSNLSNNQ